MPKNETSTLLSKRRGSGVHLESQPTHPRSGPQSAAAALPAPATAGEKNKTALRDRRGLFVEGTAPGPGRPARALTADELASITTWATEGKLLRHIAHKLQWSESQFRAYRETHPEAQEAFETGDAAFHDSLLADVRAPGKMKAVLAYALLKSRHGYRENDPVQTTPLVNVTIVQPMSVEDYKRSLAIDVTPTKQIEEKKE